nr:MAG TPA: hypothetical protein [Caudoviricetes sp.]
MTEEDIQQALLQLADEMTSSWETAEICIYDMELENNEELFQVAQYLKHLIYIANGNA